MVVAATVAATATAAVAVALVATAVAIVTVTVTGKNAAHEDEIFNRTFFYVNMLGNLVVLGALFLFAPPLWFLGSLAPFSMLFAPYLYVGIKNTLSAGSSPKVIIGNVSELRKFVSDKTQEVIERHRKKAMAQDGEFSGKLSKVESDKEEILSIITILEAQKGMTDDNENAEFSSLCIEQLKEDLSEVEEDIRIITAGKHGLVAALRQVEASVAKFGTLFDRLEIGERIANLRSGRENFRQEILVCIEKHCQFFYSDIAVLFKALEDVAFIASSEVSSMDAWERDAEAIGDISAETHRFLESRE